ncbi:MAG TPA: helix-turn-helix domain-containing protein [Halieaceae bacterium]|nr:helix-turn-helix domain-containing protein [Halieaceae bacterium]
MSGIEREPRPETYALDRLIQAATSRAQGSAQDNLLFLGHWHQAYPTAVVCDPVLEPVDKVVWMVIMLQAHETGGRAAFPRYEVIAELANIASTSTIARAIAILRLTRWLSLCARVRASTGQFQGNVYALHDNPLPLADALYLDEGYMAFVRQSERHSHARVRRVATAVLATLAGAVEQGEDPLAPLPDIKQRVREAMDSAESAGPAHGTARSLADLTAGLLDVQDDLLSQPDAARAINQHQNSKAVDSGKVVGSSSCSSNTTTTTTTTTEKSAQNFASRTSPLPETAQTDALIFPRRLTDNQRTLALQYLTPIPAELHQPLLDELAGRVQAETQGAKPLYDELRFFYALCRAARTGAFVPNLGLKVADARNRRRSDTLETAEPAPAPRTEAERDALRQTAAEQLALIQQTLGRRPRRNTPFRPK